ncbi:MAG: hypothetical protein AB7U92_25125 [Piscinibacter sp.]|uniref:hypothetical protein n=1 Tax=Piscinibacter sp. TaxID=1903157 RepID=UPI003D118756
MVARYALTEAPVDERAFVQLTLEHLRLLRRALRGHRFRIFFGAETRDIIRREQRALACVRRRRHERGVR